MASDCVVCNFDVLAMQNKGPVGERTGLRFANLQTFWSEAWP